MRGRCSAGETSQIRSFERLGEGPLGQGGVQAVSCDLRNSLPSFQHSPSMHHQHYLVRGYIILVPRIRIDVGLVGGFFFLQTDIIFSMGLSSYVSAEIRVKR